MRLEIWLTTLLRMDLEPTHTVVNLLKNLKNYISLNVLKSRKNI